MKFRTHAALAYCALAVSACGGSPPAAPVTYKPLDYSYLPPIILKVSTINVQNQYVPDPDTATLLNQAPVAPANALTDMANHRLVANGAPGTASFTVEVASIDQVGANLNGAMTVRLDVATPDNRRNGYTEASVSYSETAPDSGAPADMQAALYDVTKHLMDEMNVQFQYQLQHYLGDWISYAPNAGAVPLTSGGAQGGGIQATPLASPTAIPGAGPVPSAAPAPAPGQTLVPPSGTLQ